MASLHKLITMFSPCLLAVTLLYPLQCTCHSQNHSVNTADQLRTSLNALQKISPFLLLDHDERFESLSNSLAEALTSLLSLFDLQERVQNQLNDTTIGMTDEDISILQNMDLLLDRVIQDSCSYVNWTLYNDITMDGSGICDISLMRQSFTCSKEAADRLRQSLEIIKTSKKSLMLIEALHCSESSGNHCSSYTDHELHLDTSYLSETDSRLAECLVAAV